MRSSCVGSLAKPVVGAFKSANPSRPTPTSTFVVTPGTAAPKRAAVSQVTSTSVPVIAQPPPRPRSPVPEPTEDAPPELALTDLAAYTQAFLTDLHELSQDRSDWPWTMDRYFAAAKHHDVADIRRQAQRAFHELFDLAKGDAALQRLIHRPEFIRRLTAPCTAEEAFERWCEPEPTEPRLRALHRLRSILITVQLMRDGWSPEM